MSQSNLNIRMDEELKQNFDAICNELGLSMSTAVTIFAKKMIREHRIPFEVSADPFYSVGNTEALSASYRQLSDGKVITKSLEELLSCEDE